MDIPSEIQLGILASGSRQAGQQIIQALQGNDLAALAEPQAADSLSTGQIEIGVVQRLQKLLGVESRRLALEALESCHDYFGTNRLVFLTVYAHGTIAR